ncbi:MAG TPA: AMP-binding protein [Chloroflexota bacterium]|nr:AMP-binding protein [Chloroflexota bacterium]
MPERHLDYPDVPFHELLARAAERWADSRAIVFRDRQITFAGLDAAANQLARAWVALGLERGERVALYSPNCPEYEIGFFGSTRAALVPSPLNPSYKEREVRYQLNEAGAAAIVVHESLLPVIETVRDDVPALRHVVVIGEPAGDAVSLEEMIAGQSPTPPRITVRPDELSALPFSSGTTGTSKGVMLTGRNLVCNATQYVDAIQSTPDDVILIFLPLYHIYGVALMAVAVTSGAVQILMERFELAEMVRLITEEHVTQLYVVPPVMLALANAPDLEPARFASLRYIQCAAAPLAPDVARRVAERLQVRVIQAYGMTEASPMTHIVPLEEAAFPVGSVGRVAADTQSRIVEIETGTRNLPPGEVGEVVIRGPQVMQGYWNAPEETANALRDGWLYSGDIGMEDEDGNLFIVDRKKEMIKFKAFSIAPAELEGILLEHPAVLDCAVIAQPDAEAGEVPRAYVVLRPDQEATSDELRAFVAERVAGYKQIRALEIVATIPRTPSGKILRRVLKEQARAVV